MQKARFFLPPSLSIMKIYEFWYFWGLSRWGEIYPLELARRLQELCPAFRPSRKGLYTVLHNMESRGLVGSYWDDPLKRDKKYYRLTPKGYTEMGVILPQLLSELRQALRTCGRLLERFASYEPVSSTVNGSAVWEALVLSQVFLDPHISGVEIRRHLERLLGSGWKVTDSFIYPVLQRLEEEGRIHSIWAIESNKKSIRSYSVPLHAADATKKHLSLVAGRAKHLLLAESDLLRQALDLWAGSAPLARTS